MTYPLKHNYPKDRVSNQSNVFSTGVDKCMLFVRLRGKLISFKREKLFTYISRFLQGTLCHKIPSYPHMMKCKLLMSWHFVLECSGM